MTIKVAIDFDEPLYPWYDLAHKAMVRRRIAKCSPDFEPTSWEPYSHPEYGISKEEWVAALDEEVDDPQGMYKQPLIQESVEAVRWLYLKGYEVHIVTARGSFGIKGDKVKRLTRSAIIKAGLPYTGLHFTPDKAPLLKKLEIDYYLDDRPLYFYDAEEMLGTSAAFLLTKPWNAEVPCQPHQRVVSTMEFCTRVFRKHGDISNRKQRTMLPGW